MSIPEAVSKVYITDQLQSRASERIDTTREKLAVHNLARQMANNPSEVLPTLVDLAIELCGAVAGGISIYEKDNGCFRWHHLRGSLERFTGATTPRDYSPCGITLDRNSPVLVQKPEQVYSWLVDANVSLSECLLVPLYVGNVEPMGTLWIVSASVEHFTEAHATAMQELAGFTGIALQMIRSEERLQVALQEQELLTREMGHRVKNLFAIAAGMIRITAKTATSKEELANTLSGRLHALAAANALVRPTFSSAGQPLNASALSEIISVVLKPYVQASISLHGPVVHVGEQATNMVALVFHEMATNAAKYGALGSDAGTVSVDWEIIDGRVELVWSEKGGPEIATAPASHGFGTSLVNDTIARHGGTIVSTWLPDGVKVEISLLLSGLAR